MAKVTKKDLLDLARARNNAPLDEAAHVACPECNGAGQRDVYPDRFGGPRTDCYLCAGQGRILPAHAEQYHDDRPVTRGAVKALIKEAVEAAVVAMRIEMAEAIADAIDKHQRALESSAQWARHVDRGRFDDD